MHDFARRCNLSESRCQRHMFSQEFENIKPSSSFSFPLKSLSSWQAVLKDTRGKVFPKNNNKWFFLSTGSYKSWWPALTTSSSPTRCIVWQEMPFVPHHTSTECSPAEMWWNQLFWQMQLTSNLFYIQQSGDGQKKTFVRKLSTDNTTASHNGWGSTHRKYTEHKTQTYTILHWLCFLNRLPDETSLAVLAVNAVEFSHGLHNCYFSSYYISCFIEATKFHFDPNNP